MSVFTLTPHQETYIPKVSIQDFDVTVNCLQYQQFICFGCNSGNEEETCIAVVGRWSFVIRRWSH